MVFFNRSWMVSRTRTLFKSYIDCLVSRKILMQSAGLGIGHDLRLGLGLNRRGMTRLIGLDWTGLDVNGLDKRNNCNGT